MFVALDELMERRSRRRHRYRYICILALDVLFCIYYTHQDSQRGRKTLLHSILDGRETREREKTERAIGRKLEGKKRDPIAYVHGSAATRHTGKMRGERDRTLRERDREETQIGIQQQQQKKNKAAGSVYI